MPAEHPVAVRVARAGDAEAISETAIAAWRVGFRGLVPERVDPEDSWRLERVNDRLRDRSSGRTILVAEVGGFVRGVTVLGPSRDPGAPPSEAEVLALSVHPQHWRQGLGRGLVEAALELFAARGLEQAIVWTPAASERNLAFYEALGFERDGGSQRRASFGETLEARLRIDLGGGARGGDL